MPSTSRQKMLLKLFQLCVLLIPLATASNIIVFHLVPTSSHRTSIWPLVERLAEKGHKITYIFPANNRDGSHPNIEEIAPSKMIPIVRDVVGDFDINFRLNNTVDDWVWLIFKTSVDLCGAFYDSPETQAWLSRAGKYDLVMIDSAMSECAYGLVHRFKAKHVMFAPVLPGFMWDGFGIVPETSSVPEVYFHAKPTEMGFLNRLLTTLAPLIFRVAYLDFLWKTETIIKEKMKLDEFPSLTEFERNTSLVLLNSHFIEDYPMSLPPMIVSYSGLWCGKDKRDAGRKPLPQDISTFINQSGSGGFIYVSFGSAVLVSGLPDNIMNNLLKAFAAFPKIKFLWRWTGDAEPKNLPKNVMLKKWFPQRDLLANSKIRGFITQAGRPSSQEALCYGVPMISFPIFADQDTNANRLEHIGVSQTLDIAKFTQADLENALKELLQNPVYMVKTKEMSALFQDRPMDPVDNALFWTEFVLRHNTSMLKPLGMNQTWWERRLLDIYAFIGLVATLLILTVLLIMYYFLKLILRLILPGKVKRE